MSDLNEAQGALKCSAFNGSTEDALESSQVRMYLHRIGYPGFSQDTTKGSATSGNANLGQSLPPADARTLALLQELHLQSVPYENLDILLHVPLSLETADLFDKIVIRHRGGYCFELNALFGCLLRGLGYRVTDYMARFWRDEPNPPPKRRHHVLKVDFDDTSYLCDVGVGGVIPRRPIEIAEGKEQPQGHECYRLKRDTDYGWMLSEKKHGEWSQLYSFSLEPQLAKDYLMPSYWCEHSEESIFKRDAMVAIHTQGGRKSVAGREFRIFRPDGVEAFTPDTEDAYREALRIHFGITLDKVSWLQI